MPDSGASSVVAVPARLQDVVESDDVALDVRVGIGDAVPYPRLCGEIDHHRGPEFPEYAVNRAPVRDGVPEEHEAVPVCPERFEPPVLQPYVVIVCDVVDADDPAVGILVQQPLCETSADEACGSGHKYGRAVELYIFFNMCLGCMTVYAEVSTPHVCPLL